MWKTAAAVLLLAAPLVFPSWAQTAPPVKHRQTAPATQDTGVKLAENGHCPEAMPLLKRAFARPSDKEQHKNIGVNLVRCSNELNATDSALEAMRALTRDFPNDPDVLFLAVHVYSDLSIRASQELMVKAPTSYQVHLLNAEALETQGKWDEAKQEYQAILQSNPNLPGIHYRLGRLYLSAPKTATTMDDARAELEQELKINPDNAGAEYVLGEMARQAEQWPDAIAHFTQAVKLDPVFADAEMGLGRALLAQDRPADAIQPLQQAVKLQPDNPATHFHLATAYRRAGRKADADREFLAHKVATEKARQSADDLKKALSSGQVDKAQQ
jgi:tetratricopeptide (TPR) repeat protein